MSPRGVRDPKANGRTRPARLPAAERRAEILRRSAKLFQQRGYTGVSIDDIGADIGVSGPALYRHVAGKEAILLAIGEEFLDRLLAVTDAVLADADSAGADLTRQRLIDAVVGVSLDNPAELTVTLRHMWSLGADNFGLVSKRWIALGERCVPLIVADHPNLHAKDAGLYVRAGGGALQGMANALRNVPRQRVVQLAATAVNAMLSASLQQQRDEAAGGRAKGGWTRSSRREQILETAIDLFRERGFRGVSMAEIAEAIGITAAAPYRHFKNKEDILSTAIVRTSERVTIGMNEALTVATSGEDALDRLMHNYIRIAVSNADLFAVSTTEYHHIDETAKAQRRRAQQLFFEEWTHCLATVRPDLSSNEALVVIRAVTGMVTESVRSRSLARRPNLADDLARLAHAVLTTPPASR
jgi:AcrR family transcriptional regulator